MIDLETGRRDVNGSYSLNKLLTINLDGTGKTELDSIKAEKHSKSNNYWNFLVHYVNFIFRHHKQKS